MKVAVLSESAADEAAIRIMVEGLLERETQPVAPFALRLRGWPSVLQISPSVYRHLYYRTEAEALVLVVDSNHSPVHEEAHERPEHADCVPLWPKSKDSSVRLRAGHRSR